MIGPVYGLLWHDDYDDARVQFAEGGAFDTVPEACRGHTAEGYDRLHALCRFIASMPAPLPTGAVFSMYLEIVGDDIVIIDPLALIPANVAGGLTSPMSMPGSYHGKA